jgi:long-chain acyl-CoA synthetase
MAMHSCSRTPATLGELPRIAAARHGAKLALVCDDRRMTFVEIDELSARLARGLRQAGLRAGDRVTLCGPNSWRWLIAYYGIARAGAIVNQVNALLTVTELAYIVRNCRAQGLICSGETMEAWSKLEPSALAVRAVLDERGSTYAPSLDALVDSAMERPTDFDCAAPDDVSTICYTSGTTGYPKGAMLTHRAVVTNAAMTAQMHGRTESDITLAALPCSHVYGNVAMNASVLTGGTLVLQPRFDTEAFLARLQEERATIIDGVPTMYLYMLSHPALATTDLSSLRCATVGGQSMPEAKMREVQERFGCPLIELWGMTEIAGLGATHPHLGHITYGSIGVPLPYTELRVAALDDYSQTLADGQIGELMARGMTRMVGYYEDEAATSETIDRDGWLHTGDLARRDEHGRFCIVDRKKDMILTAGYNIYPAELERVIAAHPAVAMVAVGRVKDSVKGELAKAYIVQRPGAALTYSEVMEFCRDRLAAYKVPRLVQFVADLPRTSTGKTLRRELHRLDDDDVGTCRCRCTG